MDTLLYDVRDRIAFVTLNRPEVLNALNLAMRDEFWAALDAIEADPRLDCYGPMRDFSRNDSWST